MEQPESRIKRSIPFEEVIQKKLKRQRALRKRTEAKIQRSY
jgi:hypothetical protein